MKYNVVKEGIFKTRLNRFVAVVNIDGIDHMCHVKNTGRLGELLLEGVRVIVEECPKADRKTKYDLVAVWKKDVLYNIDSQMPNKAFYEFLLEGRFFDDIKLIKPEAKYKDSRFDFYVEYKDKKAFIEVKGVTKEVDLVMLFPDAPTKRGVKHLRELCECIKDGYEAYAVFVIGADTGSYFTPDEKSHGEFARMLSVAKETGVKITAFRCDVKKDSVTIKDEIGVVIRNV